MLITLVIILITAGVSIAAFKNGRLLEKLILWPPPIQSKREWWRLLSYGLVHADGQHLLFNMITLFFFGSAIAQLYTARLGLLGFPLFYASALLVSILPSYLHNRNNPRYRSLGASGAVSAVMFAYILLAPWSMILVFVIPVPAIIYAIAYTAYAVMAQRQGGGNINHNAHLTGAAYGVLMTMILFPSAFPLFLDQLAHPRFPGL
ncbi:MAG: rhomboid family intramembrane serine protease [Metallibacterium sp.]